MYDYTRQTDEELSFTEDAQLEVYDTSDPDWILVGLDGEYGFAPANYIELQDEVHPPAAAATEAAPPSLPRRPPQVEEEEPVSPMSPAHNPAAALAGIINQRKSTIPATRAPAQFTPEASDEEETTPTLPARPQSQATAPVEHAEVPSPISPHVSASLPHNRASTIRPGEAAHFAPGGFHMYNINEMVSVMGKRKKMPTTLGINIATGVILIAPEKSRDGPEQKWTAEKMTHYSIEGKHVFLELVRPSKSVDFHAGAKDTAQEIVSALGELAGAVRAEGLSEILLAGQGGVQKKGQLLYDFMAQGDDEVTVAIGDEVIILDDTKSEEWWQVRRIKNGKEGVVPSSYVEITGTIAMAPPSVSGVNAGRSTVDQNRLEEERLAKESLRAAREDSRGEVGPGMRLPERGSSLSARDNNHPVQQRSRRENGRSDASQSSKSKSSRLLFHYRPWIPALTVIEPDPSKVRTWTDRSKSFSVEAQFLALKDGKINLHKMNGVKIAVPVVKMSIEDLEYVERITGVSLDEDKPLSDIKKQKSRGSDSPRESGPSNGAGATVERKPEYDWFQFFLSCDVAVGLCERYAQAFNRDSMDESVLPDVDAGVLRSLGLREGDIIKVMRTLDKKFGRTSAKRNVSFGGEEVIDGEGGLFSGPGGTLRNNTRKGRPAPAVQTSDVVDPKAFSRETDTASKPPSEAVPTPLASVPTPAQKDVVRSGFEDDAWDVKPSKQPQPQPQVASTPSPQLPPPTQPARPQAPTLTGSMQELSLLSTPLEPVRVQPPPQSVPTSQPQIQQPQATPQLQGPPAVTPSFFSGIGSQQTGLPPQQTGLPPQQTGFQPQQTNGLNQYNPQMNFQQQNIARQRPAPPPMAQNPALSLLQPPQRPLSAPQNASAFAPPPLQAQRTGYSTFQAAQVAPPGQSLNEINQQRMQQSFQNPQQNMGMMPQPTGFNQFNGAPNGFPQQQQQFPMQTGQPQQFMNNSGAGPFTNPQSQQFSPIQPQPTGFQSSFPAQQQFGQPTGINSFLPPPLQPQPTSVNMNNGMNGYNQSFTPPPMPPIPQQQTMAPLVPQKTGPPPPGKHSKLEIYITNLTLCVVRFGVNGDTKRLTPQATGRRANLSQASMYLASIPYKLALTST